MLCITLRSETEWVKTVEAGWNVFVANDSSGIIEQAQCFLAPSKQEILFGDGKSSEKIVRILEGKS